MCYLSQGCQYGLQKVGVHEVYINDGIVRPLKNWSYGVLAGSEIVQASSLQSLFHEPLAFGMNLFFDFLEYRGFKKKFLPLPVRC